MQRAVQEGLDYAFVDHRAMASAVISSAFAVAQIYYWASELPGAMRNATRQRLPTPLASAAPGIPANLLPEGVVFAQGPCTTWGNSPEPVACGNGAITPCFSTVYAAGYVQELSDAAASTELSSGRAIFLNAYLRPSGANEQWRNYAWVDNPLAPSTVIWDSAIHGLPNGKPGSGPSLAPGLGELLGMANIPEPGIFFDQMLTPAGGLNKMVGLQNRWFMKNPLRIPVHIGLSLVQFPDAYGGNNPGTSVKPQPDLPPPANPPPPNRPPPDTWRPFDPKVRTVHRYTSQMRMVSRVVGKAGPGVRESKGNIAKAVSTALDVMGSLSEIGDDIDSVYKSLPASIRRDALAEFGKSLTWRDKLEVIYENVNEIDIKRLVAGLITSRVDDFIAAKISEPLDKALQVAVPDYLTRLGVRQAIRWAYWTLELPSPIPEAPSTQGLLGDDFRQEDLFKSKKEYAQYMRMVEKRHQAY